MQTRPDAVLTVDGSVSFGNRMEIAEKQMRPLHRSGRICLL